MLTSSIGPAQPDEKVPEAQPRTGLRAMLAASSKLQRARLVVQRTVMVTGVSAIGAIGIMFVRPELTDHIKAMSPFSTHTLQQAVSPAAHPAMSVAAPVVVAPQPAAVQPVALPAANVQHAPGEAATNQANAVEHATRIPAVESKDVATKEQKWVTNWLAKRYRVAGDAANMLVSATYRTAQEVKIDPLLVLAVMAIESGFNPFAESPVGAQGLMQVMSKVHHDKFQPLGGVKAALNPVANIKVGATILKEYVSRGGSVESGLKMYVGAAAFETDSGYGYKVLAEYKRLKDVASGKAVPVTSSASVVAKTPPKPAPQPVAEDKVEVLTQADTPSQREKTENPDGGVIAAL